MHTVMGRVLAHEVKRFTGSRLPEVAGKTTGAAVWDRHPEGTGWPEEAST